MSICHLDCWARGGRGNLYMILVFDQFIWRPKVEASSCITVIERTRTSNISASKETSSAKSKSVNTSFSRVTPVIPRCTVRSIIWSIGPRNRSGAILQHCWTLAHRDFFDYCALWILLLTYLPHPTANQSDITPSTLTQLHVSVYRPSFHEIHNFAMQVEAA